MYKWLVVTVLVLGCAWFVSAQAGLGMNGTNATSYNDTNMTMTDMDMDMTGVFICPKGYFSPPECNETCASVCGPGNDCDPVNGTCSCNSCWNGTDCTTPMSSSCFQDYLSATDKETALFQSFGNTIPVPELSRLQTYFRQSINLVSTLYPHGLHQQTASSFDSDSFALTVDERSDTSARPLAKVSFRLLYNQDRTGILASLDTMRDLVKRGNWRATLAIQNQPTTATSPDDALITLNV